MSSKPYSMAVAAFIDDGNGNTLLLKRAMKSSWAPGEWETPGGKIDPGETFEQGLIREVKEETNLDIELDSLAGATEFEIPKLKIVLLHMHAHIVGGEFQLSHEHDDFAWLPLTEFRKKELCAKLKSFPGI